MGCFGHDDRKEVLTREVMDWREIHARPYELTEIQEDCRKSAQFDWIAKHPIKEVENEEH